MIGNVWFCPKKGDPCFRIIAPIFNCHLIIRFLTAVFYTIFVHVSRYLVSYFYLMSLKRNITSSSLRRNTIRNISYGRIMSRLNCSAISYVQLQKKLLPLFYCNSRARHYSWEHLWRETSSQWHEIILNDPSGIPMRNVRNVEYKCSFLLNKEERIWALFRCHCPCRSLDLYLNWRRISSWNTNLSKDPDFK